jgi:hypothetical protein
MSKDEEIELLLEFYQKGVLSYNESKEAIRLLLGGEYDDDKV